MPTAFRAPGVYVEELPSGVHPIVGISTATAAFVDVFDKGPVGVAVKVSGPGEFERTFGGVSPGSEASYAITQFFNNGGSQAWVVRVLPTGAGNAVAASAKQEPKSAVVTDDGKPPDPGPKCLTVTALSEGQWGNALCFGIQLLPVAGGGDPTRFDFVVGEVVPVPGSSKVKVVVREAFRSLSIDPADPRYCPTIVSGSQLVRATVDDGATIPAPTLFRNKDDSTGMPDGDAMTKNPPNPAPTPPGDIAKQTSIAHFHRLDGGKDGKPADTTTALAKMLLGDPAAQTGIYALNTIAPDIFNILCIPAMANITDDTARQSLLAPAEQFCADHRAMLLIDPPAAMDTKTTAADVGSAMKTFVETLDPTENAATYFPRLVVADPVTGGTKNIGPSGTIAGIWSRTDTQRGVWKAPAGTEATLMGARPAVTMTEDTSDEFNPIGINVLRTLPVFNNVVWGSRTMQGADLMASQWKYIPVRRTALYIEESLRQGLQWVVFEPNDEPLWAQIRLNVGAFMQNLFRLGAFAGQTPQEAYLVKCDSDTTTAYDVSTGVVNIRVGFQPLLPCEFVVIQIQQLTLPAEV
ncbi:phage tail sheath protein FI (plasmid) [Mycobacterium sp. JS623]|uniref:phage tail sheath family protein n=1 Tax=Mycobacterium sp. JS623 TaxID=212767 RepID=UPI0002A5B550|nr:phage tail sheath C-terminal domain-containing protein [Mycobacterium sp. JS623]AGB26706.1 phage tail sheath protein FI [Mycobacterium sp. JS623]